MGIGFGRSSTDRCSLRERKPRRNRGNRAGFDAAGSV